MSGLPSPRDRQLLNQWHRTNSFTSKIILYQYIKAWAWLSIRPMWGHRLRPPGVRAARDWESHQGHETSQWWILHHQSPVFAQPTPRPRSLAHRAFADRQGRLREVVDGMESVNRPINGQKRPEVQRWKRTIWAKLCLLYWMILIWIEADQCWNQYNWRCIEGLGEFCRWYWPELRSPLLEKVKKMSQEDIDWSQSDYNWLTYHSDIFGLDIRS